MNDGADDTVVRLPLRDDRRANMINKVMEAALMGARVCHNQTGGYGRLSGWMRYERDNTWLEVDTDDGAYWWLLQNVTRLGPV